MGLFDGFIGNATKVNGETAELNLNHILVPGEHVEHAYEILRDWIVFTSGRLILIDVQGLTGSKVEYHSIPYKSIYHYSVETAGMVDLHDEMQIWIAGRQDPIQRKFTSGTNILEVQTVLSAYILGYSVTSKTANQNGRQKSRVDSDQTSKRQVNTAVGSKVENSADIEFCFHCGESVKGAPAKCPKCNGSLL